MYDKIISDINNLLDKSDNKNVVVAIDGPSASGKSFLADSLLQNFSCNIFHMDDFFLTPELRTTQRLTEVGGNVDYQRFESQILENIVANNDFIFDIFDCRTLSKTPSPKVFHKQLNIIEGVYSLHPTLKKYYDYKIFLTVDEDVQKDRILNRSSKFLLDRYVNEWIPLENNYFEKLDIKNICDIAIDTSNLF